MKREAKMYMSHTAEDHRAYMGLPADYTVDGVLAYGTWDLHAEEVQLPALSAALDRLGVDHELRRIDRPIIGHAWELIIGSKRYWFAPVMGTAVMATYLHLGSLLGSKRNILLGVVGGLAPGMKSGDLIVPTAVIGNDSARMYDRSNISGQYRPDASLTSELMARVGEEFRIWTGTTTTCEMMLAETLRDVNDWSAAGILGVEMEGALTFALSGHFGIPSAALFFVTDNLVENETLLSEAHREQRDLRARSRAHQYDLGLSLLLGEH